MSNDLQASITTQLGQAVNDLTKVEQGMRRLETAMARTNKQGRDLQKNLNVNPAKGGASSFGKSVQALGGAAGGMVGRALGGIGVGGAGGVAMAGAAALGAVWASLLRQQERMLANTEKALALGRSMKTAAAQAALSTSQAGRGIVQDELGVRSLFGQSGIDQLDELQQDGIPRDDAIRGLMSAGKGKNSGGIIQTARNAARLGLTGFGEAVDTLSKSRRLGSRAGAMALGSDNLGAEDQLIADLLNQQAGGRRFTSRDIFGAKVNTQLDLNGKTAINDILDPQRSIEGQITAAQRDHFLRTGGSDVETQLRGDLALASNPAGVASARAMSEAAAAMREQVAALNRMADGQNRLVGFIQDVLLPDGSLRNLASRATNDMAAVTAGGGQ